MHSDYARIEAAITYLAQHTTKQPSLEQLAAQVELSPFHFQRLFHQWAGVSPKTFLQWLTLNDAKAQLASSASLLSTSLNMGLSGPSRLHDLFLGLEKMTPGEFKAAAAGLTIDWAIFPTLLGPALFASTPRGLCGLTFTKSDDHQAVLDLHRRWPAAQFNENPKSLQSIAEELQARLGGQPSQPLSLLLKGTSFQIKVWEALLQLPEGALCTYQDLADHIGSPAAVRAVGTAVGANPLGVLIPCHRVIRATGAIGGYRWGEARKRTLLALERGRGLVASP